MKKNLLLFVFVCLLSSNNILAQTQPTVNSPVYYCQNSTAVPLTASASAGSTLIWYGTNSSGGTGSSNAPIPSTATVGTTSYYVSQTNGVTQSTRNSIVVNVVADNSSRILNFRCDPSQIATGDRYSSVFFDWSNTTGLPNQYTYSYSIDGGTVVTGTTVDSHLQVFGLSQGQSVTLTLQHTTYPCDRSFLTCTVPCLTLATPTFNQIAPICSAASVVPVLPSSSLEGINGTWSPAVVSTTASGTYTFTPNPNECATTQTMNIVVNPDNPGFSDFSICSGNGAPNLDTTSPNGVTGTWNPATIDDMNSDSYTFTPDSGQCASPQTITVTVIPSDVLVDFNWTVTEAFAENQKITVTAIAAGGDYLYKLDDGPFQSSPVFEYVASGSHSITVMDQEGCSMPITKNDILVINYPKYFTPNNDGFNDTWNVKELSSQPSAYIRIFDRYGKFLKQISPNGNGWNGAFNGYLLPADDYWFVIHYLENNIIKEFKSHFALKR